MNQLKVTGTKHIAGHEFTGIEGGFGEGKKAMLVKDIAEIHVQPLFKINERINNNRNRFKDGVDIEDLKTYPFKGYVSEMGFSKASYGNSNNIYILSERGYAKLLKILEDDKAWEIYDELVDGYFSMRKTIKQSKISAPEDDYAKRLRAEAMSQNAKNRAAKLLQELSRDTDSTVNKALLQDKAVEVLTGEKLLEMPKLRQKMYSAEEIAKRCGVLSRAEKPHGTAVSQLIQTQLILMDDEMEIFPESKGNWSGPTVKYAESVLDKVSDWLEENNYPSVIVGQGRKNYHVHYLLEV